MSKTNLKGFVAFVLFLAFIFVLTLIGPLDAWKLWLALAAGVLLGIWVVIATTDADHRDRRRR